MHRGWRAQRQQTGHHDAADQRRRDTRLRSRRGFTAIETAFVIALIAGLVLAAVPLINMELDKTRLAFDEANIRSAQSLVTLTETTRKLTVDGQEYTLPELYDQHVDATGAVRVFVQKDGSLSFEADDAITFKVTNDYDGTLLYPAHDHRRGAHLLLLLSRTDGDLQLAVSSDANASR